MENIQVGMIEQLNRFSLELVSREGWMEYLVFLTLRVRNDALSVNLRFSYQIRFDGTFPFFIKVSDKKISNAFIFN